MLRCSIGLLLVMIICSPLAAEDVEDAWVISRHAVVRETVSARSQTLARLPMGTAVTKLGVTGSQTRVRVQTGPDDGVEGYVASRRLADEAPDFNGGTLARWGSEVRGTDASSSAAARGLKTKNLNPTAVEYATNRGVTAGTISAIKRQIASDSMRIDTESLDAFMAEGGLGDYADE